MTELAPREKLAITGAESLSDAELLAIFAHRQPRHPGDGTGAANA